ncbi:hypothetical protein CPB86DRAFT_735665 [Serendipita vermifera]|nr:hypothetical protein CPB86DRAFT_735665 [Serendipita vermifera]
MYRRVSQRWFFLVEPFLLVTAFLLQTCTSLSLPIVKSIYLFSIHIQTSAAVVNEGEIRIGLWGFCFLTEFTEDVLTEGTCSPIRVGYTIPEAVISQIGLSPYLYDLFSNVLSAFLIVHPVVATLTLITIVTSLFPFIRATRVLCLILNIISAILSTIVAGIDLSIIIIARNKLAALESAPGNPAASLGLDVAIGFGPAPWMGLMAVFALWLAVVTGSILLCSCCGYCTWDAHAIDIAVEEEGLVVGLDEDGEDVFGGNAEQREEAIRWKLWWQQWRCVTTAAATSQGYQKGKTSEEAFG